MAFTVDRNGAWSIFVNEFSGNPARYTIRVTPMAASAAAAPGQGTPAPFSDIVAQTPVFDQGSLINQFGIQERSPSTEVSASILDAILPFLINTVWPLVFLLLVQRMMVAFVRRFMMRRSDKQVSPQPSVQPSVEKRVPAPGELRFLDAPSSSGVVLTGKPYERLRRATGAARLNMWGFFGSLVVFATATGALVPVSPQPHAVAVAAQLALSMLLLIFAIARYQAAGNPFGPRFATLTIVVLSIPAVIAAMFGSAVSLLPLVVLPTLLFGILRRSGRRARDIGKQDLLVLRVFGVDANAVRNVEQSLPP